ncbi:hypothetical protein CLAFUW4_11385 [Fulvia fulva]|uniref:Uncharacterized protein n=1 Tax=Passalora fulva TaxID=5499 RepID=A0A9Q8PCH1_PASFU|nr:uncharacterized protein CLAFUR5_10428 [Fulvia fulva]KAK4619369.1 hypothetical protein CLAFUR4_11391 [Fulvia fulva]UJO19938.1 hypothetical protein CLAFUR5_10428 [Fulvia fulva]WPV17238.1 hypothetical protein CLAFUW4_11385 [Fulvia fulva]WPV32086.1 hypothetical protein CLAFUW7_11381 [Fulvia fulva]
MAGKWHTQNDAPTVKDPTADTFKITALPKTDIWRRTDDDDVFNAPMIYQKLKASDFKSISVTIFAPWKTQYDQGGLILAFPSESGDLKNSKWIKAGIEYHNNVSVLGIVGTDRYSDWSIAPMSQEHHQKARFRFERDGQTLWVYGAQEKGEEKLGPMREVKWAFMEGRLEQEVWVGVYAAKPTTNDDDVEGEVGVEVTFSGLEVEVGGEE